MDALAVVLAAGLRAWSAEFRRGAVMFDCGKGEHYFVKQNGQWVCTMCGARG